MLSSRMYTVCTLTSGGREGVGGPGQGGGGPGQGGCRSWSGGWRSWSGVEVLVREWRSWSGGCLPLTMWLIPWCIWCYLPPLNIVSDTLLWKHNLRSLRYAGGNKNKYHWIELVAKNPHTELGYMWWLMEQRPYRLPIKNHQYEIENKIKINAPESYQWKKCP